MQLPEPLQSSLSTARARVRVGYPWWLRPFLLSNVIGITLGRTIFIAPRYAERPSEQLEKLVRHELVHIRQIGRYGVIGFYARYVAELVRHLIATRSINAAYHRVSFEIEAYAAENEVHGETANDVTGA